MVLVAASGAGAATFCLSDSKSRSKLEASCRGETIRLQDLLSASGLVFGDSGTRQSADLQRIQPPTPSVQPCKTQKNATGRVYIAWGFVLQAW